MPFAYVAARIANALSTGKGAGQRGGFSTQRACLALNLSRGHLALQLRSEEPLRRSPAPGSSSSLVPAATQDGPEQGLRDALRREVRDGACEIEVEGALHRLQRA